MEHSEWLQKVSKGDSINASANKAGIQQRTLARQVDREHIDAESVIALAIAYGIHPVGALVETEYLDEKWANQIDPFLAVRKLTDEQILEEILRRMKLPGDHREFTTPVDELIEERHNSENNHAAVRDNTKDTRPYAVPSFDPETMAAYTGDDVIPPDDQFDA